MKKLLSIILATVMIMSAMAIPAFADQPYYPCYEGTWNIKENSGTPIKLKISNVNSNNMDIYFQYGQFAINTTGKIDGKKVNANYREVWEGGDFIVSGTITLDLGDQGIWLDWHPYENSRDGGTRGYMFYNSSFKYKSAINDSIDITVELNGSQLDLEQNPIMVNDSVLLPIRAVAESMGAEVTWTEGVRKIGNVVGIQKDSRYIGFCVEDTGYNENYNQTAYIDDNGVINFKTVENEESSQPIQGTITLSGDSVNLNITSSEQRYITPKSIEFYKKNTQSRLK